MLNFTNTFPLQAAISYNPETPDGLQNALAQAMSAPLEEVGIAAKNYIMQFLWSLVGTNTTNVYHSALGDQTVTAVNSSRIED